MFREAEFDFRTIKLVVSAKSCYATGEQFIVDIFIIIIICILNSAI